MKDYLLLIASMAYDSKNAYEGFMQISDDEIKDRKAKKIFTYAKNIYKDFGEIDTSILYRIIRKSEQRGEEIVEQLEKAVFDCIPEDIDKYINAIKLNNVRNEAIEIAQTIIDKANSPSVSISELSDTFGDFKNIELHQKNSVKTLEEVHSEDNDETKEYLTYGSELLDNDYFRFGGRALGETKLILGVSGHGKSYYAVMLSAMLARQGQTGIYIPLEDTTGEYAKRASVHIPLSNKHFLISERVRTLSQIVSTVISYKKKFGIKWIVIDHLGRVKHNSIKDRIERQIYVSNELTDLCEDIKINGNFLVQPKKPSERRRGYENFLDKYDIKGASELFEDAFVIDSLIRPNEYEELTHGSKVESPNGDMVDYNSVFVKQIKNRRQKKENAFLHLIHRDGGLHLNNDNIDKTYNDKPF
jgi:hypothetical protein